MVNFVRLMKNVPRSFLLFLSASSITTLGDWLGFIALAARMYNDSGSATSLGILFFVRALPQLVIDPVGGIFADRFNKGRILTYSSIFRGAIMITVAFTNSSLVIYVLMFLSSLIARFEYPAGAALLPQIVEKKHLLAANSAISFVESTLMICGPIAGGLVTSKLGPHVAVILDGLSSLIAGAIFLQLTRFSLDSGSPPADTRFRISLSGVDKATFQLVFALSFLMLAGGAINVSLLPYVSNEFSLGASGYGTLTSIIGAGFVLGSLLVLPLSKRVTETAIFVGGLVLIGFVNIGWAIARSFSVALAIGVANGVANVMFNTSSQTLIQKNSPPEKLGLVIAFQSSCATIGSLLGITYATALLDIWGARAVIASAALIAFIVSAAFITIARTGVARTSDSYLAACVVKVGFYARNKIAARKTD